MIVKLVWRTDKCFIFLLFTIGLSIQIDVDIVNDGQVIKLEMLAPKTEIVLLFAGCPCVQVLVQTQLTKIPKWWNFKKKRSSTSIHQPTVLTITGPPIGYLFRNICYYHFLLATPFASRIQILRELSVLRTCSWQGWMVFFKLRVAKTNPNQWQVSKSGTKDLFIK